MSKIGDLTVRFCNSVNAIPSLLLCFFLVLLQICAIDYYLIHHLVTEHLFWVCADVIVIFLYIACFKLTLTSQTENPKKTYTVIWVTWLVTQSLLAVKVIVICTFFSTQLEEEEVSFFGPNTLKTSIALGSCIFVLLLTSQHDSPLASYRRRYIEELTGTVVFDILDTADILEVLFDKEDFPKLSSGIPEAVLSIATLNLLLPTVPLITLSKTKFGLEKLQRKLVYLHRLLVVLAVNVPNLLLRMALWHIYSVAVSPFTLKNIILICMTLYEFYEHKKEKFEQHKSEAYHLEEISRYGKENTATQVESAKDERSREEGDGNGDNCVNKPHHINSEEEINENPVHFDIVSMS